MTLISYHHFRHPVQRLRHRLQAHGFRSGEIMLARIPHGGLPPSAAVAQLFHRTGIQVLSDSYALLPLAEARARALIEQGLTVKPHYTILDRVILPPQRQAYLRDFAAWFHAPHWYGLQGRITQAGLPLADRWQSFGALVLDARYAGIFWVNDLLDYGR